MTAGRWPTGGGEMARRIREHDWASTPLGPIEGWPQSLKTAVEMVLAMPAPATILWGPEHVQLYNDAYVAIARDRHPALLGSPAEEGWPDAYNEVIAPLLENARAGRTTQLADFPVALRGPDGRFEERVFDTDWSPIRDESGAVAGSLQTLTEVTDRRRAQAAVRESEERLHALVVAGANSIYRMSPDWRLMYQLDSETLAVTSEPIEDWVDKYILPEDLPRVRAAIGEAIRTRSLFELEHRVRLADGGVGWVLSRAVPLLGADGEIFEWFGAGSDVTARKHAQEALRESEQGQSFLLELSDALRPLADPAAVAETACRVLVGHLDATRAQYTEVEGAAGAEIGEVRGEHVRSGRPMTRRYPLAAFGEPLVAVLRAGESLVLTDTERDPRLTDAERGAFSAVGSPSAVAVPLVKEGRLVATFAVHDGAPRDWTNREVALIEETAERTWAAVERARAEAALRESEAKYRSLFDTMAEGFTVCAVVRDDAGRVVDLSYVELNQALERQTGLDRRALIGRRLSDVITKGDVDRWMPIYAGVADTGEPVTFEEYAELIDRWYAVSVYRRGEDELSIFYQNITERKRAEAALRESEERQAFLLKLSDALRPLADATEIQATTAQLLGTHFGADRAMYAEVEGEPGAEAGIIRGQYVRPAHGGDPPVAPFPERFAFGPFGPLTMAGRYRGEVLVVADVDDDPRFGASERAAWGAADVRAAIVAPLAKGGRLVAEFGVHCAAPRAWTDAEVSLVSETAERTWAAAERARAEEALRASEGKYRTLFESIDEGFCVVDLVRDDAGEVVDYRFVEVNRVFERQTGVENVTGKTDRELGLNTEPRWLERYGEVARTGEPLRAEDRHESTGRWYQAHVSRVGGGSRRVAIVFDDITGRKRREADRELLVDVSEDLSRLSDEEEILRNVGAKLAAHLKLDCFHYVDVDEERAEVTVRHFWHALDVSHILGTYPIDGFMPPHGLARMRAGGTSVVNDVQGDLPGDTAATAALKVGAAAQKIGAYVAVPYSQNGRWKAYLAAADSRPRRWTSPEIELIQEVSGRLFPRIERARAEEALRESEERHRLVVEGARDYAIVTTDPGGTIESWSPGAEAVFGWAAEEAVGRTPGFTFTPEDREAGVPEEELAVARRDGSAPDVRWHLRKDGSRVFIEGITRALRAGDGGEPRGFLKVGQDVTERRRAEEALRASEERYRTLVENVADHAVFMLDPGGLVTEWTESALRVKGYAAEEVIGRHVSMFYAPEAVEAGDPERELAEAARDGRAEREQWRVKKGGGRIWVDEIATAVRDEEGALVGFTKISRDLTERREAEEALRESRERLRAVVENAPIVLVAIDEDGVYRLAEGKGHEALGVEPGAAVGRSAFEVFRGNPGILEDTRRALAGEAFTSTRELNGALWETTYTPLRDGSGEPAGAIAVGTDVTDRRRAEEERVRLRERELAALAEAAERERISRELHDRVAHHMGVAHQSLELHAALAKSAPERAAEKLALARETTRFALDQTRALSAELKRLQEEELSEGIGAALRALPATMSDGVEVDVRSSGDESAVPKPVALQVYLAMREAVRNAVRHSGGSYVGVELDISDGEIVGSVEDDGKGFDPEAVGKASPSWGVGLGSMRERAEMLGGSFRLDSAPGAGTRVEVRVPLDGRSP